MKNFNAAATIILIGALLLSQPAYAQPTLLGTDAVNQVASPQQKVRQEAFEMLGNTRVQVINASLSNLAQLLKQPDRSWEGPLHLTIATVGAWRITEGADLLVPVINLKIAPSLRPGITLSMQGLYPAARSLAQIGGPRVVQLIFNRLVLRVDDETLRCCTWVLREVLGAEVAKVVVQQHMNTVTTVLKNIGGVQTNPEKENLQRVKDLLENDPLILRPSAAPDTPTAPTANVQPAK